MIGRNSIIYINIDYMKESQNIEILNYLISTLLHELGKLNTIKFNIKKFIKRALNY